jgi:2-iminobutanoate/2-iminopropanoate deaminase
MVFMRQVISTSSAPKAIGPYSQAIKTDSLVFLSGQVALDPASGTLVGNDVQTQTEQVFRNIRAVLAEAGSSLDKVVRTTVYLRTMNDFGAMNEVYGKHLTQEPPARSTVAVAGLPKDALVEIDVIALA